VAEVNTWGGLTDEYEVEVLPTTLQQYGLSMKDVFSAIEKTMTTLALASSIMKPSNLLFVA
jgi:Cu/Ag efflux pump CusA